MARIPRYEPKPGLDKQRSENEEQPFFRPRVRDGDQTQPKEPFFSARRPLAPTDEQALPHLDSAKLLRDTHAEVFGKAVKRDQTQPLEADAMRGASTLLPHEIAMQEIERKSAALRTKTLNEPRGPALSLNPVANALQSEHARPWLDGLLRYLERRGVDLTAPFVMRDFAAHEAQLARLKQNPDDLLAAKVQGSLYALQLQQKVRVRLTQEEVRVLLPHLIESLVIGAADEGASCSREAWVRSFGKKTGPFFDDLLELAKRPAPARPFARFRFLDVAEAETLARANGLPSCRDRMPVLDALAEKLAPPEALAGFAFATKTHLFPTTPDLFFALQRLGLRVRDNTVVLGKTYSANPDTIWGLKAAGFGVPSVYAQNPVASEHDHIGITEPWDDIKRMVDRERGERHILLMDDGANFMVRAHSTTPELAKECVAVEQTQNGLNKLREMTAAGQPLLMPVVNMAESWLKKRYENIIIGESIAFHTEAALASIQPGLSLAGKEVALLGYGAVNQGVAQSLKRRGCRVYVYDIDGKAMAQAKQDGFEIGTREEVLAHGQVLISSTGKTALTPEEFDLLPDGAILANGGSGNFELGMDKVEREDTKTDLSDRDRFEVREEDAVKMRREPRLPLQGLIAYTDAPKPGEFLTSDPNERVDAHGFRVSTFGGKPARLGDMVGAEPSFHRVVHTKGNKEMLLLHSGYVVNMTMGIPPEFVQITLGLLLASCIQATRLKNAEPGIYELDDDVQRFILETVQADLQLRGLSLEAPDFRDLASWRSS